MIKIKDFFEKLYWIVYNNIFYRIKLFLIGRKLLNKVKKISIKYDLTGFTLPVNYKNIYHYLDDNPEMRKKFEPNKSDGYFIKKYIKNISCGHYGFSLGTPIYKEWVEFLDEVLELCIKVDPNFGIHQIKTKYGYVCFYCDSRIITDIFEIECYILEILSNKDLIY